MYKIYAKLRDARGVTDYRVAKDTGIGKATLTDFKRGNHEPSLGTLKKLADYFGVTIDYFVNGRSDEAG